MKIVYIGTQRAIYLNHDSTASRLDESVTLIETRRWLSTINPMGRLSRMSSRGRTGPSLLNLGTPRLIEQIRKYAPTTPSIPYLVATLPKVANA